jgi:regulatory protein YycI of two-component signal transduction system YycFG
LKGLNQNKISVLKRLSQEGVEGENLPTDQRALKDQDLRGADLHSIKKEIKIALLKVNADLNFILSNIYRMY